MEREGKEAVDGEGRRQARELVSKVEGSAGGGARQRPGRRHLGGREAEKVAKTVKDAQGEAAGYKKRKGVEDDAGVGQG